MGDIVNIDGTPARSSKEPDQEPEGPVELPAGAMLPVLPFVCPRCQLQTAVQVMPVPLYIRADGVVLLAPQKTDQIVDQVMVVAPMRFDLQCPRCTGSGLVVPAGMPGGMGPMGPRP